MPDSRHRPPAVPATPSFRLPGAFPSAKPLLSVLLLLSLWTGLALVPTVLAGQADQAGQAGQPGQEDAISLPLSAAAAQAAAYGVRIEDWRGETGALTFAPGEARPDSRQAWIKKLSASLTGYALTDMGDKAVFTLLPKGMPDSSLGRARTILKEADTAAIWKRREKAAKLDFKDARVQALIKGVRGMTALEQEKTMDFQRVVNPENPTGGYSFRVRYDESAGRLVPFEKNGEPVEAAMEGFTSYSSVTNFLDEYADSLEALSDGEWTFFTLKGDPDSVMAVKGDGSGYDVAVRAVPAGGPQLEYQLTGDATGYSSLCRIFLDSGTVVLADSIVLQ